MKHDSRIFDLIKEERERQLRGVELIASENFVSQSVMDAMGSELTNKYAEGFPGKRYYGGCEVVDQVEDVARARLKERFGAEYVNVQPHSGSQANAAVFLACLQPGDKIMGFDLSHGGHLTHGSPVNFSGRLYQTAFYGVERESGLIDYGKTAQRVREERPKMLICGASAYSRDINFAAFRQMADEVGALLLADIAHPAGMIATGLLSDPIPHCHIVTSTTHKTLRGPRGGIIMMGRDFENPFGLTNPKGQLRMMSSLLDSAVFPGTQGGPLIHVIAAKAVAFGEALSPAFARYQEQVRQNARALAAALVDLDYHIISGGTDNHCMLIDLRNKNCTGKIAEKALVEADITANKNMVPFDDKSPFVTSGIRLGVPAVTTRGLNEEHMTTVAHWIDRVLQQPDNEKERQAVRQEVNQLMVNFPLFADEAVAH